MKCVHEMTCMHDTTYAKSRNDVIPPHHTYQTHACMHATLPLLTFWICCANSRVGARMSACTLLSLRSICWRTEMENVAVLPVPDCACAMVSRPDKMGIIPGGVEMEHQHHIYRISTSHACMHSLTCTPYNRCTPRSHPLRRVRCVCVFVHVGELCYVPRC